MVVHVDVNTFLRAAATVAVVCTMTAPPVVAQSWRSSQQEVAGWIGISFEVLGDRRGRAREVRITEVSAGSPAEIAGLRAGDRLMAINDIKSAEEMRELNQRLRLRVGDRVVMEIRRDGERHRIRLRASERPREFGVSTQSQMVFGTDSMVDAWAHAMDALRIELVEEQGQARSIRVERTRNGAGAQVRVVTGGNGGPVSAPFEFFVFRGEDHDSLRQEMIDLNQVVAELEQRMVEREGQLRLVGGTQGDLHLAQDSQIRTLRRALDEATARTFGLERAMAEAARETAGLDYSSARLRLLTSGAPAAPVVADEFRPLTPYLLGRNRVAGAEVIDLRAELAQYFEVEGGVLVVDVAPGTPASLAGIVPGDVIIRLDQVGVRSVEDLRFGVSQASESLPISLIRQGVSIQVLLRR